MFNVDKVVNEVIILFDDYFEEDEEQNKLQN